MEFVKANAAVTESTDEPQARAANGGKAGEKARTEKERAGGKKKSAESAAAPEETAENTEKDESTGK